MYQGNAALSLELWWEKPAANDELASDRGHYNYFRYYDTGTGRYMSADPIGQLGGINLYTYSLNNPVRYTDPAGLNPAAGAIAGGIVGGPPGAVVGALIGLGIGIAIGDALFNEDGSDSTDFPDDEPKQCSDEDKKRKNCQALKDSILSTCAGLTGKAKFRCFAAANTAFRQCMGYE